MMNYIRVKNWDMTPTTGYSIVKPTFTRISRSFSLLILYKDTKDFVKISSTCQYKNYQPRKGLIQ